MEYLRDFSGWKAMASAVIGVVMATITYLFGDPRTVDGAGVSLVAVLLLADFAFGTAVAFGTDTWSYPRLKGGVRKLLIWACLLAVARRLAVPIGIVWATPLLTFVSHFLIVYLALVDLVSVLRHAVILGVLSGVALPGLERLAVLVERWQKDSLENITPPGWCQQPESCKCTCQSNGKSKGAPDQ